MRLVLASASATRRRMLEAAEVAFDVETPTTEEEREKTRLLATGAGAAEVATGLAALKALGVAAGPETLVLGSDQVLETEQGEVLSKAASRQEAAGQLRLLAGRRHALHSAAVLAQDGEVVWRGLETARLRMRPFGAGFLADYLDREWDSVRYNVGCYRIEGMGVQLFEEIEGSHFAILGLPLLPLLAELRRRGLLTS